MNNFILIFYFHYNYIITGLSMISKQLTWVYKSKFHVRCVSAFILAVSCDGHVIVV